MSTIILIGCGMSVLIFGVTACLSKFKRVKKAIRKWTRENVREEQEEIRMDARTPLVMDRERESPRAARCVMATESGIEESTGERFVYITLVKPPRDFYSHNTEMDN